MTDRIWSRSELERFLRWEDPEVRCWAADRLARHFPEESTAALAPYLFDDHDLTPETVAGHVPAAPAGLAALAAVARRGQRLGGRRRRRVVPRADGSSRGRRLRLVLSHHARRAHRPGAHPQGDRVELRLRAARHARRRMD